MTKVKICGITGVAEIECGADNTFLRYPDGRLLAFGGGR